MRKRFWVEVATSALSSVLFVVTLFWPDWIEFCFGVDPDGGDASTEWLLVAALAVFAMVSFGIAKTEWRRSDPRAVLSDVTPDV